MFMLIFLSCSVGNYFLQAVYNLNVHYSLTLRVNFMVSFQYLMGTEDGCNYIMNDEESHFRKNISVNV